MALDAARDGGDLEAGGGEQHGRDGPDAARRTGDQDGAVLGLGSLADDAQHGERRGVAGGAEGRGTLGGDAVGQRDGVRRLDVGPLREAAVTRLGLAGAVEDEPVAGAPARVVRLGHLAHHIDAGDQGSGAHDARATRDGEAVLVVEVAVGDVDDDAAVAEELLVYLLESDAGLTYHNSLDHGPTIVQGAAPVRRRVAP